MDSIERMGGFYLGKEVDPATGERAAEPLMYDARDLTTHAVCVGMTGSGKTGLCIGLLEEAALDGVPALIIDPKGDITNLLLTFPELRPADFAPWINTDDARRKNLEPQEYAKRTAQQWREGLAEWDQQPERIARLRDAADFRIYTPGSSAGERISILSSLKAPRLAWEGNEETLRDQIRGTVSALLGLAGIAADPLRSPEHILLSTLFERAWREGRDLDLASLITSIQNPPVRRLGVFDIDTFFPPKDRFGLAMALNSILAAPGFADWFEGQPLDIDALLQSPSGKPRHAIFSIAHLDDAQRMFFVTLLLEQTLSWMRRQSGTTSLRALMYMDEIFGYLPPTANPPSKQPMMTLLKQARAFGLGIVLATQNPVDLDYKALSNTGTWFIGKLQTERDKARILDGLDSLSGGTDRSTLDRMISGLGKRVFLLHNVHEDGPVPFQTRWVMSYLRGPLTREQIRRLRPAESAAAAAPVSAAQRPLAAAAPAVAAAAHAPAPDAMPVGCSAAQPPLPPGIEQVYLPVRRTSSAALDALEEKTGASVADEDLRLVYRPRLVAVGRVAFVDSRKDIDAGRDIGLLIEPEDGGGAVPWTEADPLGMDGRDLVSRPETGAVFAAVPERAAKKSRMTSAAKDFKNHLYRDHRLEVFHLPPLKLYGEEGETEAEFLGRARQAARELRDGQVDKLRAKVQRALDRLEKKLTREERELAEDEAEYSSRKQQELLSAGETLVGILGIFGGRKRTGLATAARKRRMTNRAKEDIAESKAEIAGLEAEIADLERQLADDAQEIAEHWDEKLEEITKFAVKPRRTDVSADLVAWAWAPHWETSGGRPARIEAWR